MRALKHPGVGPAPSPSQPRMAPAPSHCLAIAVSRKEGRSCWAHLGLRQAPHHPPLEVMVSSLWEAATMPRPLHPSAHQLPLLPRASPAQGTPPLSQHPPTPAQ